jgi:phage baseplate assembly protein W
MKQIQKTYDFKSVGQDMHEYINEEPGQPTKTDVLPIGIKTPISFGDEQGLFVMNTTLFKQVSDNLRNLILTNWGERLGLYDFGGNLKWLSTELTNSDTDGRAMTQIANAVAKYMPYVNLSGFSTFRRGPDEDEQVIQIGVRVTYSVEGFEDRMGAMEVVIDTIG